MGDATTGGEGLVGDALNGEGQGLDESGKNNMDDAKEKLEEFDWKSLEERFWCRMEECRKTEDGIMGEFGELVQVRLLLVHWPLCAGVRPSCIAGVLRGGPVESGGV